MTYGMHAGGGNDTSTHEVALLLRCGQPSQPPPALPAPAPQDHAALRDAGVAAFYGPGTRVPAAALDMLSMLLEEPELAQIG